MYTVSDILDTGIQHAQSLGLGLSPGLLRRLCENAIFGVAGMGWRWYQRREIIPLHAPVVATGSLRQNVMTLPTGMGAEWMLEQPIRILNHIYTITHVAGDVLTLDGSPLGNSEAVEMPCVVGHARVLLGYRLGIVKYVAVDGRELRPVPEEAIAGDELYGNYGQPTVYTVVPSRHLAVGERMIQLHDWPMTNAKMTVLYESLPLNGFVTGYSETDYIGTISVNGILATGNGTAFSARHAGCVIRIGLSDRPPDGRYGSNPFSFETRIAGVESPTSLVLHDDLGTLTDAHYRISSEIDCPDYLWPVYQARLRYEIATHVGKQITESAHALRAAISTARQYDAGYAYRGFAPLPRGGYTVGVRYVEGPETPEAEI